MTPKHSVVWQALADPRAAEYMKGRKVLEINPDHPIVKSLNDNFEGDSANAAVCHPPPFSTPSPLPWPKAAARQLWGLRSSVSMQFSVTQSSGECTVTLLPQAISYKEGVAEGTPSVVIRIGGRHTRPSV